MALQCSLFKQTMLKIHVLVLLVLLVTFNSCKKTDHPKNEKISLTEAKSWLQNQPIKNNFDLNVSEIQETNVNGKTIMTIKLPNFEYQDKVITYSTLLISKNEMGEIFGYKLYYAPNSKPAPLSTLLNLLDDNESSEKQYGGTVLIYTMSGKLVKEHIELTENIYTKKIKIKKRTTVGGSGSGKVSITGSELNLLNYYPVPNGPQAPPPPGCRDFWWVGTYGTEVISVTYMGRRCNALAWAEEPEGSTETWIVRGSSDTYGESGLYISGMSPTDTVMKAAFFKNAKVMCALLKLMQNNFYKKTLNNFIGANKPIDLTFKLEALPPIAGFKRYGAAAPEPFNWKSTNVDIIVDINNLGDLSGIQTATVLLHEGIHAEIWRKLLTIHGAVYLSGKNFPEMFKLYQDYKLKDGFSHEFMANYYIDAMATTLKAYDNSKFDITYYKALSWDGLEETDSYNKLSLTQKADITTKTTALLLNRSKVNCDDI